MIPSKKSNTNQPETDSSQSALDAVVALSAADMARVDACIHSSLQSEVVLINQIARYIVASGGKRLRPMLLGLCAHACDYQGDKHIPLAAIIEFIHTATLLHDDVIDESDLRRGQQSVHAVWGNAASVLVGDFLYSRSFQMMVGLDSMRIMQVLADATNTIAEGEVMQLMNCHDPETTEARYLQVIYRKTGKLFEAGMQIGAILAAQTLAVEESLVEYGKQIGLAFQLVDDALDYQADAAELGKNIGTDLAEGKPTLPLIYALQRGSAREQLMIRHAIEKGGIDNLEAILGAIQTTGALAYTLSQARAASRKAIASLARLPDSLYKEALVQLAGFAVERRY